MKKDILLGVFFALTSAFVCNGGSGDRDSFDMQRYQNTKIKKIFLVGQIAEKFGFKGLVPESQVKGLVYLLVSQEEIMRSFCTVIEKELRKSPNSIISLIDMPNRPGKDYSYVLMPSLQHFQKIGSDDREDVD